MTTGSINYSPDHKSRKPVKRDAGDLIQAAQRIWDDSEAAKERARLEREVIEAIKSCRNQEGSSWEWLQPSGAYGPEVVNAWQKLSSSLDALLDFESQIKK